jgi:hypothetical protein
VEIVIAGEKDETNTTEMLRFINERFIPEKVMLVKDESDSEKISKIAAFTRDMVMSENKTTVHLCQDQNCKLPSNDIEKIKELIEALSHI